MTDPRVLVRSDRVREALEAAGLRSASAGPLRLEKAWPLRDGAIVGLYGGGATPAWRDRFAVAGCRSSAPSRLERRALEAGTLHALPGLDGLALRFPADPWLPQLASVGAGRLRAHPISYKPMRRCSFELRADDASPPSRYLKCYRAGDLPRVRQVYDELEAARARGGLGLLEVATRHQGAAGSELLAWDPVRGPCLTDLLLADEAEPVAMTVGAAVADLHASDVVWPLVHRPEDELEALARWVSIAARAFPAEARRLREVREAVAKRASRHSPGPVAPAHRDLHDGQILLGLAGVTFIDFDTACRAEPELDVANLLAHLRLRRLMRPGLRTDPFAHAFLAGYSTRRTRPLSWSRLRWYLAGALLRLACVHAFRPTWRPLSSALLDHASQLSRPARATGDPCT